MVAVSVKNVTKDYKIYSKRGQKLKELLTFNHKVYHETKRALENMTFDVAKGECIGIIGDNGSGKSTILKILAGTSYPTGGEVKINGEVSYILDVATGFNFDFTGRENIYTKCALLGLTPDEIHANYDSIVEFSGLSERIDHPIKTFSTGMIVRLGFSIAVHVPFDILIVDEVLSVGDYLFQRKCISAIRSIIDSGKTVIITSHSLSDVANFCHRLVLLRDGQVALIGDTDSVIQSYIEDCECRYSQIEAPIVEDKILSSCKVRLGNVSILDVKLLGPFDREVEEFWTGDPLKVIIKFHVEEPIENPCIRIQFLRNDGLFVMGSNTYRHDMDFGMMHGDYETIVEFAEIPLLEGDYYINMGIWPDEWQSYTAKTPFDIHEYRHLLKVHSRRKDGGGITKAGTTWRLNHLQGPK